MAASRCNGDNRVVVGVVLFVPRLVASSALAPDAGPAGDVVGSLLVLGTLFFFAAARLNIAFEEGSIVASARRAARVERLRSRQSGKLQVSYRRFGPLFRLGETGPAEVAIVWKNVIALVRTGFGIIILMLVLAAGMIALGIYMMKSRPTPSSAASSSSWPDSFR